MFSHRIVGLGILVAAGGWIWLAFGIGSGEQVMGREVINLHSVALAENVIHLGYVLCILGVLAHGFERMTVFLAGHVDMGAAWRAHQANADDAAAENANKLARRNSPKA